jgi:hypothetical protein
MKKGDVFVLQEGGVQGYYAYWGIVLVTNTLENILMKNRVFGLHG